jgi:hypothetical protein
MSAISDETATTLMGPKCEHCGWRKHPDKPPRHRPAVATMGVEACPNWTPPPVEETASEEPGVFGRPEGAA